MRWWTFLLLLIVVLALQSTLAANLSLFGIRPDWLLLVVVFFALFARAPHALIAAWIVGMCADLLTIERVGLLSLTYTVSAAIVITIRESVFRYHLATQLFVTFVLSCLVQLAWLVYRRMLYPPVAPIWAELPTALLLAPLYTAMWGVLFYPALSQVRSLFGLSRPRYTFVGTPRMERGHV